MMADSDTSTPSFLFINSIKFWGGGEQWFLQCAQSLQNRGYPVCIVGRQSGAFLERIAAAGLPILPLKMGSDFSPWDLLTLRKWISKNRVTHILCNLTRDIRITGIATRTLRRRPQVHWIMGSILLRDRGRDRFWARGFVDHFVVPSHALAQELEALGYITPERISVLPIGLDLNRWPHPKPAASPLTAARQPTIGIFGRLEKRKGHETLLHAWSEVRKRVPDARLWVVGTGSEDQSFRKQAEQYGESVRFWGHSDDVPALMRDIDIMVQPSLYEPFGITLLEAMACGKPIVCTCAGGMPEVVNDQTAIVVPPEDPHQLAEALIALLNDPARASTMGQAGRRRVERVFPLTGMIDRLESILGVKK